MKSKTQKSNPIESSQIEAVKQELALLADPQQAVILQRFFKTGPGEYGAGDIFRGIKVPVIRQIARKYQAMPLPLVAELLRAEIHEDRLLALLILVLSYKKADSAKRAAIYELYLANTRFINNWDLVDLSAAYIVGPHLFGQNCEILHHLARSILLWDRRIAIMASFYFIRQGEFDETLRLAEILLHDREDLIHKAVGWMLREIGNRDRSCEEHFLQRYYREMPRTMLRYAIEKFPEELRQDYLKGRIG
jgi:3-methyladenine DNA glycosylase AlkD